jgi:cytochrome c biogenesis protein
MRFAIGLLTILAIASVIGTVLKQNEPYPNYAFEFGQYWFSVFEALGLYDVYHTVWFIVILAFLVTSTTLCIIRNGPGFIKDIKSFREKASDASLGAMKHSTRIEGAGDAAVLTGYLAAQGFRFKMAERPNGGLLIAAKKGSANKIGYFFAHIALVVICIGGLLDGNLPLKLGEMIGRVVPETRNLPQKEIPAQSRLSVNNLSFRGDITIAENKSADVVFINQGNGYLVQDLPFLVTLKQFKVDYYSNGMPKLFSSDIVVTDKASGKQTAATVMVNHPLIVDGVAIYQASFGDGGSPLTFRAWDLAKPNNPPRTLSAVSLSNQPLATSAGNYTLETTDLRLNNVEEMASDTAQKPASLEQKMKDAREVKRDKRVRNLGPSITFKLRDKQGQAREFFHYMAPITLDGSPYLIAGVRAKVADPFQYVRLPLDDQMKVDSFMRFYAALKDPALYDEAARRATQRAFDGKAIGVGTKGDFETSVRWILNAFGSGGFGGIERMLDTKVPADKRQAVAQTFVKILQGASFDVMDLAQQKAGLGAWPRDDKHYRFLLDGLVAASGLGEYQAPVFLELTDFKQVQASGLQLTRSPGKTLVYLGSVLLVFGIILMFYIREVRLWLRLDQGSVQLALASNRQNRDLEEDFARHRAAIQALVRGV